MNIYLCAFSVTIYVFVIVWEALMYMAPEICPLTSVVSNLSLNFNVYFMLLNGLYANSN